MYGASEAVNLDAGGVTTVVAIGTVVKSTSETAHDVNRTGSWLEMNTVVKIIQHGSMLASTCDGLSIYRYI